MDEIILLQILQHNENENLKHSSLLVKIVSIQNIKLGFHGN